MSGFFTICNAQSQLTTLSKKPAEIRLRSLPPHLPPNVIISFSSRNLAPVMSLHWDFLPMECVILLYFFYRLSAEDVRDDDVLGGRAHASRTRRGNVRIERAFDPHVVQRLEATVRGDITRWSPPLFTTGFT